MTAGAGVAGGVVTSGDVAGGNVGARVVGASVVLVTAFGTVSFVVGLLTTVVTVVGAMSRCGLEDVLAPMIAKRMMAMTTPMRIFLLRDIRAYAAMSWW